MVNSTKGNVPELAGSQDAEDKANLGNDVITAQSKSGVDLVSWFALGKPSRTRKQKRTWRRASK